MAFPTAHSLVTWFGDSWQGQEEWQFGLRIDSGFTTSGDPTDANMTGLLEAGEEFMTWSGGLFSRRARLLGVKHAKIGQDGKYVGDARERFLDTPAAGAGPAGSPDFPQICVVFTTLTNRARGFASRGRFYSPPTAFGVDADGRMTAQMQTACIAQGKAFLEAVNAVGIGPVTVYSQVGEGIAREVTGVRVGRVFDTQRRRRESLPEEYAEAALTP